MEKNGTNESGPAVLMTSTPTDQTASTHSGRSKVIKRSTTGNHSTTATPTAATTNTSTKRGQSSQVVDSVSTSDSEGEKSAVVMIDPPSLERANKRVRTGTKEALNKTEASSTPTSSPSVRVVTTEAVTLVVTTLETASLRIKSPANFITKTVDSCSTLNIKGTAEFDVKASVEGFKIKLRPGGEACVKTRDLTYFIVKTSGPTTFLIKEGVGFKVENFITFHPAPGGMVRFNANGDTIVSFRIEDDAATVEIDASKQLEK